MQPGSKFGRKKSEKENGGSSSFSSTLKLKYGHLIQNSTGRTGPNPNSNSNSLPHPSTEPGPERISSAGTMSSGGGGGNSMTLTRKLLSEDSLLQQTKSKRNSQSFTPSQPERFNNSLNFWHSASDNPLLESDSSKSIHDHAYDQDHAYDEQASSLSLESKSSPYLLNQDSLESTRTRDRAAAAAHGTFSSSYGGMAGSVTNISMVREPTGFSWTSSMLLDNNNIPDAAAANTNSIHDDEEEEEDISSSKILSESLLEQVMPESPMSYRPSPLAKYSVTIPTAPYQPHPFSPFSTSPTPTTPSNSHDPLASASTTPIDVLKRRLERSEETMHQYEQDLVSLQSKATALHDANTALRKELEEEKRRCGREEREVYDLEQDRDLCRLDAAGLRAQVDELMSALKVRDSVENEQRDELSETLLKLEAAQQKCIFLEETLRETTEKAELELEDVKRRLEAKALDINTANTVTPSPTPYSSSVSVETQSDFPIYIPKPISVGAFTEPVLDSLMVDSTAQTDLEEVPPNATAIPEDLSAFIVNKDESIFNQEQLQSDFAEHEIKKLVALVEANEAKIVEVKGSLDAIHTSTMQVRQDLVVNTHFGKEVERWVDNMKSSVESVETFILDANQALKFEKRRSERMGEILGKRVGESRECQTDVALIDSKYVQTKNDSILLNAGIQTSRPHMVDQDMQTNDFGISRDRDIGEEDSLQFYLCKQDTSLLVHQPPKTEVATQTMLLFDMMGSDFITQTRKRAGQRPESDRILYGSSSLTSNLVQLFVTLLCLLVGYVLYNVYEVFWFIRSALRAGRESKISII